jgi:hypothetical protein
MKKKTIYIVMINIFLLISINFFSIIEALPENKIRYTHRCSIDLWIDADGSNDPAVYIPTFQVPQTRFRRGDTLYISLRKHIEIFSRTHANLDGYYKAYVKYGKHVLFTTDEIFFDGRKGDNPSGNWEKCKNFTIKSSEILEAYVEVDYDVYNQNNELVEHKYQNATSNAQISQHSKQKLFKNIFTYFFKDFNLFQRLLSFKNFQNFFKT